jgi:hypothetical protein
MWKLRNVCSILVKEFKGKYHVVGVVSIDVMLELSKYEIPPHLISQLKTGVCCCRIMHKFKYALCGYFWKLKTVKGVNLDKYSM